MGCHGNSTVKAVGQVVPKARHIGEVPLKQLLSCGQNRLSIISERQNVSKAVYIYTHITIYIYIRNYTYIYTTSYSHKYRDEDIALKQWSL